MCNYLMVVTANMEYCKYCMLIVPALMKHSIYIRFGIHCLLLVTSSRAKTGRCMLLILLTNKYALLDEKYVYIYIIMMYMYVNLVLIIK
jgi:hypothetical protein